MVSASVCTTHVVNSTDDVVDPFLERMVASEHPWSSLAAGSRPDARRDITLIAAADPKRREQPECKHKTASGLGPAGQQSMTPTRTEAQHFKELSCAVQPGSTDQPNNFCDPWHPPLCTKKPFWMWTLKMATRTLRHSVAARMLLPYIMLAARPWQVALDLSLDFDQYLHTAWGVRHTARRKAKRLSALSSNVCYQQLVSINIAMSNRPLKKAALIGFADL